ncbi:unnamed protein product, partial [Symbiodinium sp. CCMP2456]
RHVRGWRLPVLEDEAAYKAHERCRRDGRQPGQGAPEGKAGPLANSGLGRPKGLRSAEPDCVFRKEGQEEE